MNLGKVHRYIMSIMAFYYSFIMNILISHFSEFRVSNRQWHLRIGWQRMWRGLIIKTKILSTRSPTATYTKKQHRPRNYSGEESSSCLSKMRTSLIYILWYVLWTYLLNWKERLTFMYTYVRSHLTIILEIQKVNGVCNNIFTTILLQKLFPKNKLTRLNKEYRYTLKDSLRD